MDYSYPIPVPTIFGDDIAGFLIGSNCWIFTSYSYEPSYWMLLKREGFSGGLVSDSSELDGLTNQLSREDLSTLYRIHYKTDPDHFFTISLREEVEELILSSRIKVFKLSEASFPRLINPRDVLYSSRHAISALGSDAVTNKRNELAEELGHDISQRWLKKDGADKLHWDRGLITREAYELYDVGAEIVDTAVDFVVSLYQIGKALIVITGRTFKVVGEFYFNIATGDLEGIRKDLEAVGIFIGNTINSAEKLVNLAKQGLEIFNQLQNDAESRDLIIDYFSSLYESIPYRDSRTIGVRIVAEVGIEVLLAIATAGVANVARRTGQAGVKIASIGSAAERIGPFTKHAVELLSDLAKKLHSKNISSEKLPPPKNPEIPEHAKSDRPSTPKPKQLEKQKVRCFKKNKKGTEAEYDRQLEGQKNGLNEMTAQEYLDGRKAYDNAKRGSTKEFREEYEKNLIKNYIKNDKISKTEAIEKADETMKTMHALHNPDMIAGGKDVVTDMGDGSINSSIGSQWNNGKDREGLTRVEALDRAAEKAVADGKGNFKMNANLHRCK